MGLAKMQFQVKSDEWDVVPKLTLTALFNPGQYQISTSVSYMGAPWTQAAVGSQSAQLSVQLFFDSAETHQDVRTYTNQFKSLMANDPKTGHPPVCTIWWKDEVFEGYLTSFSQSFTMFQSDGTPVRATCSAAFIAGNRYLGRPRPTGSANPAGLLGGLGGAGGLLGSFGGLLDTGLQVLAHPGSWKQIVGGAFMRNPSTFTKPLSALAKKFF